jgi:hypothetical protein
LASSHSPVGTASMYSTPACVYVIAAALQSCTDLLFRFPSGSVQFPFRPVFPEFARELPTLGCSGWENAFAMCIILYLSGSMHSATPTTLVWTQGREKCYVAPFMPCYLAAVSVKKSGWQRNRAP